MSEPLPRAIACSPFKLNGRILEWRVYFDTDEQMEYDLWKVIKKWQLDNCEGDWDKDFTVTSVAAKFRRKEDALLCYLAFG